MASSAKHFIHDPAHLVASALRAVTLTNPGVALDEEHKIVYRRPGTDHHLQQQGQPRADGIIMSAGTATTPLRITWTWANAPLCSPVPGRTGTHGKGPGCVVSLRVYFPTPSGQATVRRGRGRAPGGHSYVCAQTSTYA